MKAGAENRKKTIAAGALGAGALVCLFVIYNTFFGGPDTPAPAPAASVATPAVKPAAGTPTRNAQPPAVPGGAAPGVEAKKLATATTGLDPRLDQAAMLRTESLVYSGSGRNIFSAIYTPPAPTEVKKFVAPAGPPPRPGPVVPQGPPPTPPLPPINLKFFGIATRPNGVRQAFLLSGEDVYLASPGDIVVRKYKIGAVNASSVNVTDLTNNNTQTLPLQN